MSSFLDLISGNEAPKRRDEPLAVAMTIAGSDSGGGAGIQADLKTFAACEVHGASVLTLITAQNTQGVREVRLLDEGIVRGQFDAVMDDLRPAAAKTGALGSNAMIGLVTEMLLERPVDRLVVDPVMISKHGDPLLPENAYDVFRSGLLPRALVVTPNRFEAEALTGREVTSVGTMKEAAKRIFDFGPRNVLVKGSHLEGIVRDLLFDGTGFVEFGADRVDSKRVHGSGCTFAAAITARLARGDELLDAIGFAREFITGAIAEARPVGQGIGPVNPMHRLWE